MLLTCMNIFTTLCERAETMQIRISKYKHLINKYNQPASSETLRRKRSLHPELATSHMRCLTERPCVSA